MKPGTTVNDVRHRLFCQKRFCHQRMTILLSSDNQVDVINAFNSTSRYLDDLLNIDNPYFEGMVNQIYPPELQLNKANTLKPSSNRSLFNLIFI